MSLAERSRGAEPSSAQAGRASTVAGIFYALTILISAFLLFQVQPLISRYILPWFGGGPAVWATCLMFFQVMLFAGYLYAHMSIRFLAPLAQAVIHVGLLIAALACLPIVPDASWKPIDGDNPSLRIIGLLGVSVGPAYFLLASTGPLVQAWFSRSFPDRSPYRLYSLSNFGSLVALVSYPFFFEPMYELPRQAQLWSAAFVVFAIGCTVCAIAAWRARANTRTPAPASDPSAAMGNVVSQVIEPRRDAARLSAAAKKSHVGDNRSPRLVDRLLWIGLPAIGSLMLVAATNHLCQDIAAVPLLWIGPLTMYLLTFIIAFDHARWYRRRLFSVAAIVIILAMATLDAWGFMLEPGKTIDLFQQLVVYMLGVFFIAMLCHGELVRLRPAVSHLTEFYLLIAAGGALGGIFVALVAPQLFNTFFEWRLGLVLSLIIAGAVLFSAAPDDDVLKLGWRAVSTVIAVAALVTLVVLQREHKTPVVRARNFYGVVSIWDRSEKGVKHRTLFNGGITHGAQGLNPQDHSFPTTYYGRQSGVGQAVRYYQKLKKVRVGVVGLGAGTMAAYGRKGDYFRFYEINPLVPVLARKYFTFLSQCPARCDIAMGDARLSLEREQPQRFDVLVLDAFSGDAIPTHLLTKEAFGIYRRHMAPGGVIAVHITNRYLELGPVVQRIADYYGMQSRPIADFGDSSLIYSTDWTLVTNNKKFLDAHPSLITANVFLAEMPLWTDHYSNLFQIMK